MREITTEYETALANNDLAKLQEIISELNSYAPSKKHSAKELYERIGDDLFDRSISITNYNLDLFLKIIKQESEKKSEPRTVTANGKKEIRTQDDFENTFLLFHKNSEDILYSLKVHFLFLLDNEIPSKTNILVLTNNNCYSHPLIQRIMERNAALQPVKKKLAEFLDECKNDALLTNNKYLCLLALIPSLNYNETDKENITALFELFKNSSHISLLESSGLASKDYKLKGIDDALHEELESICGIVFNNKDLTFEEEKIIKKSFQNSTSIIDYKILKGGFSGSKVIEIQPIKNLSSRTARYVIKYSRKDAQRKISKEIKAFKAYIDDFQLTSYRADFLETEQYEAIKYTYASADNKTDSYSFSELIKRKMLGKKIDYNLNEVISQLLTCAPLDIWSGHYQVENIKVDQLYKSYINDDKLLTAIEMIESRTQEQICADTFWKNYAAIKEKTIEVKKKVCHGDLHTENFFKDDSAVYLIDFGYTGEHHAVLDHSTLEASLRFKHIPAYIRTETLIKLDERLFDGKCFEEGFDISFIDRKVLTEVYTLILTIRKDARKFFAVPEYSLEYFISLFMITMRQIQYNDLNQQYALESAKSLAKLILENPFKDNNPH